MNTPRSSGVRRRLAVLLIACGAASLTWAVFTLCSAGLGGPPEAFEFAQRRSYDEVKRSVHAAFGGFALRALGGFLLLRLGLVLRRDA
ncbi:MAG: hypothetical protein CMJ84_04840 [Planctomycetes bacterium]|nr:hypothetical protein [Planctomycetota bacterium]MDP6407971.1 hypothetical protein [Planctomycetota bacterium]